MTSGSQRASTARPCEEMMPSNLLPIEEGPDAEHSDESGHGVAGNEENVYSGADELKEHVEELTKRVAQQFEDEHESKAVGPQVIKAPAQPSRDEWEKHKATHTPYKPWCPHCAAARAVRKAHPSKGRPAHIVPDIDGNKEGPIKISIDYMYLDDRKGQEREANWNPPYLVAVEHKHGRCWAYQVMNKGIHGAAHWSPKRIVQDWENSGFKEVRVQLKSDQEPSIVELQSAIQLARSGVVIPVNSPVGESEANGRVENPIRRIQEKVRVLRHQMEAFPLGICLTF